MTHPQRKRVRLEGFDYSTPGCYFVTINALTRAPWFGTVADGILYPNEPGKMVRSVWESLPHRYPGIITGETVVMPDHVHGIIMLGTDPTLTAIPTLSDVIGTFKSLTTLAYGRGVREDACPPSNKHLWHRSFRDTIIRTDHALNAFRAYIDGNPGRWSEKHGR